MIFSEFPLHPDILKGLEQAGFTECTRVQEKTITQVIVHGRDVTVQSQTGTGKTAAFLIPSFQLLLDNPDFKGRKVLVLAPTRELAVQIDEEAKALGTFLPFRTAAVYGGVGYGQQEEQLKSGVDLLIGTPGRLLDFIAGKKINPKEFGIVIIDEADRLLDMGFYPDIRKLLSKLVGREQRRTMLLSATMSTRVSNIAWEHMNDPANIVIEAENVTVDAIEQRLFHVAGDEKMDILLGLLARENPGSCLIFANTKRKTEEVAKRLEINGYKAHFIMGDMPQKKRLAIINEVKQGRVHFLVATDVAARGLHINDLDMVVNYDLPEDSENYVHRIGRTARAGKTGKAYSLACERFVYALEGIEKYIGMKIPVGEILENLAIPDKSKGQRIQLSVWDEDGELIPGKDRRTMGKPGRHPRGSGQRDGFTRAGRGDTGRGQPPKRSTPPDRQQRNRPVPPRESVPVQPIAPKPRPAPRTASAPSSGTSLGGRSMEERLAYYRQKYGDSFVPTPELIERLKRDEQRAKEKGGKIARAGASGHTTHPQAGNQGRNRSRSQDRNRNQGQHPQASRQQQAKQSRPVQAVQNKAPEPPVQVPTKQKKGGLLGWVKGLFRGKEQS